MNWDFIRTRLVAYVIAAGLVAFGLLSPFLFTLNLGIDMTGGTQSEYSYEAPVDMEIVRATIDETIASLSEEDRTAVNTSNAYAITGERRFVVEIGFHADGRDDVALSSIKTAVRETLRTNLRAAFPDAALSETRYQNVGESFGAYIRNTAYLTLSLVIIAISAYIAYAFWGTMQGASSLSFAIITVVTLIHDVVATFGLYVLAGWLFPQFAIDTFFITALLTVLGYSINDTIVILDRMRSMIALPENKNKPLGDLINTAIRATMTRSIYTSSTVVFVLLALFFFGPAPLSGFVLALLLGTVLGTYSSVFISAPMLYDLQGKAK
ncbi:MAG TPA: protein translocase subunit SecF [bacterium]|nr:protein translocase subunit SecF [bacterium]